jgi:serine phosphatase RsbU (regulator of sigma subunit)/DNA-binding CsgD family transcriptional regulator
VAQEFAEPVDGGDAAELASLRAVVEAAPVLMIAVEGPELRVVAMSAAGQAASQQRDWRGVPLAEVYPELVVQGTVDVIAEVHRTGVPFHAPEWRFELVDPVGGSVNELYLNWTVVPWSLPDGSTRGVIAVAPDVSDQVRARQRAEREAAETGRRYRLARDVVSQLQQALLPNSVPVLPRLDLAARYLIAGAEQSAGGDWFDVRPLADGRVGLAIGDVVGHGVTAAAVMSQLRAVLARALDAGGDPAAAVAELEQFAESLPGARSATVVVAVLDPGTGSLDYVTRGHPPPLLVDASRRGRQLLGSGGGPLGSAPGGPAQHSELAEGDVLVLFSDGLVERPDRPYTAGLDELTRLAEGAAVGQLWPSGTSPSAVERICTDAVELLTRRGFHDDVTVLAAARQPPVPPLPLRPDGSLPGRRPDAVPAGRPLLRPRLLTALSGAVDRAPVTLVSGPAGSGKTVLVATWARRAAASRAVGWVGLGHDDVEVAEFWTAVLTTLAGAGLPLPDVPQPGPGERLAAEFTDRLASALAAAPAPVVLVLDDADHLHAELVDGLHLLVTRAAGRLLLVLTASADPLPLLGRYRAAGALAEIRGDQLRLRPPETRELLSRLGTPVSAAAAAQLSAATEGSPVAVRLAAAELARGVPAERLLADLAGTDTAPVHHLAAAVLAAQPPSLRRFLLRVSVADHLWPELVERVAGVPEVDRPLAALARAHAFVEADAGAAGGYRIPTLLRTLLSAQLAYESPEEFTALHRAVTDWTAAAGPLRDGVAPAVPTPPRPARPDGRRRGAPPMDRAAVPDLSPREREVLHQLAGGRSTTQIAAALDVSVNTVRGHVRTLQRKLTAPDRDGLAARARDLGLL